MSLSSNARKPEVTYGIILALLTCAVLGPITARNVLANNTDYPMHLQVTGDMLQQHALLAPWFLWNVTVIAIKLLLPIVSMRTAGVIATIGYNVLTTAVTYYVLIKLSSATTKLAVGLCALSALLLSIIEPISIFTYPSLYFGYVIPNAWHNSTIVTLKPFALATFLGLVTLLECVRIDLRRLAIASAASALSVIAKPSYAICILPVGIIVAALRGPRKFVAAVALFLPTVALLGWQFALHYAAVGKNKIVLYPFYTFLCYGGFHLNDLAYRFLMSIAYPLLAYVIFQAARRSMFVNLAWATFAFAAFLSYFMVEEVMSPHSFDCSGNFAWSGQIASFILFVATTAFVIGRIDRRDIDWRMWLTGGAFGLHIISGIAFYIRILIKPWPP